MSRRPDYEWSPDEDERLRLVWKFAFPLKVIARTFLRKRTPAAIKWRATTVLGLPSVNETRKKYGSHEWRQIEMHLMAMHATAREIAAATGMSLPTVRNILKAYAECVSVVGKKNSENVYRLGKRKSVPPFE